MPANRIVTQPTQSTAHTAGPLALGAGGNGVMILVVDPRQQAAWLQVYRLAEERARKALERPRHHERFFSVWN